MSGRHHDRKPGLREFQSLFAVSGTKILICHGALDSFIPEATIQKVRNAFEEAKVDYEIDYYSGAVHSFTVPDADKHNIKGVSYNAAADRRSWQSMLRLFNEVFQSA
jgi:dienelactone hydrolase